MEIKELLERAAAGEVEAWQTLVERYGRLIWALLRKFRNLERETLEDLFQDVWALLLSGGLKRFRGSTEHELGWYLQVITANEAKSVLRKHSRRFEVAGAFLTAHEDEISSGGDHPGALPREESTIGLELQQALLACIQQLRRSDQEVFWMRQRGFSYEETNC